jgi:hypothetical protein
MMTKRAPCHFFGTPRGCREGAYCRFEHVPTPDPIEVKKREIRCIIDQLRKSISELYDLHCTDERGYSWPVIHLCHSSLDCRSHPRCMMKNLKTACKILEYHKKVREKQKERHAIKEALLTQNVKLGLVYSRFIPDGSVPDGTFEDDEIIPLPERGGVLFSTVLIKMQGQHANRQNRTYYIVEKKEDRVKELVDRLNSFVTKHTDAILKQCTILRTFSSNQEKIGLLEERITRFVEEEKWYKSELDEVFRGIQL